MVILVLQLLMESLNAEKGELFGNEESQPLPYPRQHAVAKVSYTSDSVFEKCDIDCHIAEASLAGGILRRITNCGGT
jgi:hypothetical protein